MNILFIFGTGSEIRQFVLSGVIQKLVENQNRIFISSKIDISDELIKTNSDVCILPYFETTLKRSWLTRIQKLLDLSFEKLYSYKTWQFSPQNTKDNNLYLWLAKFIGKIPYIYNHLSKYEKKLHRKKKYISNQWASLLELNQIGKIVINVARLYPNVIFAAKKLNINVVLAYHTNKDIFAQGRLYVDFDKYGVWNSEMRDKLIFFNPQIPKEHIEIIGCSHFGYLGLDSYPIMNKQEFNNLFSVKSTNRIIILFTASEPRLVPFETKYITDIESALKENYNNDYKIIVRKNPMDFSEIWDVMEGSNIIVIKPDWYYNKEMSFNYTHLEDLIIYKSLLTYADCCVNIPSTVTLECAFMKLKVVNICYGNTLAEDNMVKRYWNAPFYKNVRDTGVAIPVFDKVELNQIFKKINDERTNTEEYLSLEFPVDLNEIISRTVNFISC